MKFSIIHPSRSRPDKSYVTISKWLSMATNLSDIKAYVSIDVDDQENEKYVDLFVRHAQSHVNLCTNKNRSAVDAINNAAISAYAEWADILVVVSDDTDCFLGWDAAILNEVKNKKDWILKTQDGIQDYIITMPVLDSIYYDRLVKLQGGLYHPGFEHLFCDTYLTCQADILGRKLTSDLMFRHNHYSNSVGKEGPDELHKRNDATWSQGEELFIKLMKEFSPEERSRITNPGMRNWLRNKGVR